jgi:hypothetical protein
MIEDKVKKGEWHAAYTSDFGNNAEWDNKWILIRTSP